MTPEQMEAIAGTISRMVGRPTDFVCILIDPDMVVYDPTKVQVVTNLTSHTRILQTIAYGGAALSRS